MNVSEATRELFWNISGQWLMYPLLLAVVVLLVFFFRRRMKVWRMGLPESRSDQPMLRLKGVLVDAILQAKVLKDRPAGLMHLAMYAGMIVLLAATAITAADADLGLDLVHGGLYLYFLSFATDIAGLLFCIGMAWALVRRVAVKRVAADTSTSDLVILAVLLLVGISGFVIEGLRIVGTDDVWRAWSPIGNLFAMMFAGLDAQQIAVAHRVLWWSHMVAAFAILGTWTYTKLVHVLLVPADVFFRQLGNKAQLPCIDLEAEDLESMGAGCVDDLTWKDLFDAQACIRCGRCVDNCPANLSGKELAARSVVQGIRRESEAEAKERRIAAKAPKGSAAEGEGFAAAPGADAPACTQAHLLVGSVISEEALWQCTTCGACQQACPASIEIPSKIVKMRTYQVSMESAFPSEAQPMFRALETNGNPWGLGWQTRSKWTDDCRALGLEVPTLAEHPDAEYLYWPGCSGAFDSRNRKVSIALVKLLAAAGVDFAILGNEEKCCGDSARRLGNEYVYWMLASENVATLNGYGVKKIIVQCPHCLTALSVDYPQLGGSYEVIHHSVLLAQLIESGKLPSAGAPDGGRPLVAYHDSCYLARYNDIAAQPRFDLESAGAQLVEMQRSGTDAFCCGAGGGRMWLEEKGDARVNVQRAAQALEVHPDEVCTACPFCLTMMGDGLAAQGSDVPARDIAEVLADSLHL